MIRGGALCCTNIPYDRWGGGGGKGVIIGESGGVASGGVANARK